MREAQRVVVCTCCPELLKFALIYSNTETYISTMGHLGPNTLEMIYDFISISFWRFIAPDMVCKLTLSDLICHGVSTIKCGEVCIYQRHPFANIALTL